MVCPIRGASSCTDTDKVQVKLIQVQRDVWDHIVLWVPFQTWSAHHIWQTRKVCLLLSIQVRVGRQRDIPSLHLSHSLVTKVSLSGGRQTSPDFILFLVVVSMVDIFVDDLVFLDVFCLAPQALESLSNFSRDSCLQMSPWAWRTRTAWLTSSLGISDHLINAAAWAQPGWRWRGRVHLPQYVSKLTLDSALILYVLVFKAFSRGYSVK